MLRERRVRVRVDLRELDLPVPRGDRLLEHRPQHPARRAPVGPEVDDDGPLVRPLDDVGESTEQIRERLHEVAEKRTA